ncbi:hypothetical protein NC653_028070 [Populus alba x Populus x berolinensis]|uniref:Uncharacterized protein n=1 Tax=Populus alba x Populus x berolinensis TaxID=444605 RepID=A0AAD6M7X8_9ROSI|nr:hypothetical protein NC653_028070 [Populus alba x Populus x berolinensis]
MDLLKEADMLWCQSSSMAIEQNHDLKELADQVPTDKGRYQRFSKDRGPTWMHVLFAFCRHIWRISCLLVSIRDWSSAC